MNDLIPSLPQLRVQGISQEYTTVQFGKDVLCTSLTLSSVPFSRKQMQLHPVVGISHPILVLSWPRECGYVLLCVFNISLCSPKPELTFPSDSEGPTKMEHVSTLCKGNNTHVNNHKFISARNHITGCNSATTFPADVAGETCHAEGERIDGQI